MHAEMDNEDIIFQSETKQKATKFRIWDIKKIKKVNGLEKCCLLSVVHTILDETQHHEYLVLGRVLH